MDGHDPKTIVRRYYEELGNQRQLAAADALFAPEFKLFPDSQPPYGPESVKQFITWLCVSTFPDLHVTIEHLLGEGEWVAAAVTLHATQTAPIDWLPELGTVPPTGKPFAMREFVFWHVIEGRIVERQIVVDIWDMLRQLDALPSARTR